MKLSNQDRLFLYGIIWVMHDFKDYMIFASYKTFGLCNKWGPISLEYIKIFKFEPFKDKLSGGRRF